MLENLANINYGGQYCDVTTHRVVYMSQSEMRYGPRGYNDKQDKFIREAVDNRKTLLTPALKINR